MPVCSRCNGQGRDSYEEDNRMVTDACYHCAGSGQVEDEVDLHDRLSKVAYALAHRVETEYRKACDNDPNGDGYDLGAAENMISVEVYFQERVQVSQFEIMNQLESVDSVIQNALLEWHETSKSPATQSTPSPNGTRAPVVDANVVAQFNSNERIFEMNSILGDDDIPF